MRIEVQRHVRQLLCSGREKPLQPFESLVLLPVSLRDSVGDTVKIRQFSMCRRHALLVACPEKVVQSASHNVLEPQGRLLNVKRSIDIADDLLNLKSYPCNQRER